MTNEELRAEYIKVSHIGSMTKIYVRRISWPGPSEPVSRWKLYRSEKTTISETLLDSLVTEILTDPKYFRICVECSQKLPIGHMDAEICHSCQENNYGIVH